jgi:aspartyl-tRNA(Asn)/glutamyl-tRNA(Gln) amidotransferase subunit C
MAQVTEETVTHVAKLARLALTPDEIHQFTGELTNILGLVAQLDGADLSAVADVTDYTKPLMTRPDVSAHNTASQTILAHAPVTEDGCFQVPKILEG